jgi:hypothetical protein
LDDFYNPDWPGVQEGFYRFITNGSCGIVPFAYGNNKLFLCRTASHSKLLSFVEDTLRPFLLHYKQVEIGNCNAAHISLPSPELVFQSNLCFIQNNFPLRGPAISSRVRFGIGWAEPQGNGVWTIGPRSELRLELLSVPDNSSTLCIDIEPFLHNKRASRRLSVTLNHYPLGDFPSTRRVRST